MFHYDPGPVVVLFILPAVVSFSVHPVILESKVPLSKILVAVTILELASLGYVQLPL